MKKILLFTALLLSTTGFKSFAETYNFKAYEVSYSSKSGNTWGEWGNWESCNIKITVTSEEIYIYSANTQHFNVIQEKEKKDTEATYYCKDAQGEDCWIVFTWGSNKKQIFVEYLDRMWAYNIMN